MFCHPTAIYTYMHTYIHTYIHIYIYIWASFLNNAGISRSVCNLHQQLSVKLWLYNAKMVLCRIALGGRVDPSWDL